MKKNTHTFSGITSFLQYVVGARSDLDVSTIKKAKKIPQPTNIDMPQKIDPFSSLVVGT